MTLSPHTLLSRTGPQNGGEGGAVGGEGDKAQVPHGVRLNDFAAFEKQSQHILNLGSQLARAHLESMDSFLADSKKSLTYLRYLLLVSLALL